MLRLLRDAEHRQHPLPHPPTAAENASDQVEGSAEGAKEKMELMGKKMKVGARSKVRRTWDKLGMVKEEVSRSPIGLMTELRLFEREEEGQL